jgi:hypothetical protein
MTQHRETQSHLMLPLSFLKCCSFAGEGAEHVEGETIDIVPAWRRVLTSSNRQS